MTPEEKFAANWVGKRHAAIAELLRDEVPLRYRILSFQLLDPETRTVKDGLPAVYLARLAEHDRLIFDLLVDILASGKSQPPIIEEQRERIRSGALVAPPKPKGRPYKNGGRDFLFLIMCAELQAKFPELPLGSGDETRGTQSAMGIALDALAVTGVPLIREREKKTWKNHIQSNEMPKKPCVVSYKPLKFQRFSGTELCPMTSEGTVGYR